MALSKVHMAIVICIAEQAIGKITHSSHRCVYQLLLRIKPSFGTIELNFFVA